MVCSRRQPCVNMKQCVRGTKNGCSAVACLNALACLLLGLTAVYTLLVASIAGHALEASRWGAYPSGLFGIALDSWDVNGGSDASSSSITLSASLRTRNGLFTALSLYEGGAQVEVMDGDGGGGGAETGAPLLASVTLSSPAVYLPSSPVHLVRPACGSLASTGSCNGGPKVMVQLHTDTARRYAQSAVGLATGMRARQGVTTSACDVRIRFAATFVPVALAPAGIRVRGSAMIRAGRLLQEMQKAAASDSGAWSFSSLAQWSGLGLGTSAAAGVYESEARALGQAAVAVRVPIDPTGDLLAWYDDRQQRLREASANARLPPSPSPSLGPRSPPLLASYSPAPTGPYGAAYSLAAVNASALLHQQVLRGGLLFCRHLDSSLPSLSDRALLRALARTAAQAGVRAGRYAARPGTTVVGPGAAVDTPGSDLLGADEKPPDVTLYDAVQSRASFTWPGCTGEREGRRMGVPGPGLHLGVAVGRAGSGLVSESELSSPAATVLLGSTPSLDAISVEAGVEAGLEGTVRPASLALFRDILLGVGMVDKKGAGGGYSFGNASAARWSCHPDQVPLAVTGRWDTWDRDRDEFGPHPLATLLHGIHACITPPWLAALVGVHEPLSSTGCAEERTVSVTCEGQGWASESVALYRTSMTTPTGTAMSGLSLALGTGTNHIQGSPLCPVDYSNVSALSAPVGARLAGAAWVLPPGEYPLPARIHVTAGTYGRPAARARSLAARVSARSGSLGERALQGASIPVLPADDSGGLLATFASYLASSVGLEAWEEVWMEGGSPIGPNEMEDSDACSMAMRRAGGGVLEECCGERERHSRSALIRSTVRLQSTTLRTLLFRSLGEPHPVLSPPIILWHTQAVSMGTGKEGQGVGVNGTRVPAALVRVCAEMIPRSVRKPIRGAYYAAGERLHIRLTSAITVLDDTAVWGNDTGREGVDSWKARSIADILMNGGMLPGDPGDLSAVPASLQAALDAILGVERGKSGRAGAGWPVPATSQFHVVENLLAGRPSPSGHGLLAGSSWQVSFLDDEGAQAALRSYCGQRVPYNAHIPACVVPAAPASGRSTTGVLLFQLLSGLLIQLDLPGPWDANIHSARPYLPLSGVLAMAAARLIQPRATSLPFSVEGDMDMAATLALAGIDAHGAQSNPMHLSAGAARLIFDVLTGSSPHIPSSARHTSWQQLSTMKDTDVNRLQESGNWTAAASTAEPGVCPVSSILTCHASPLLSGMSRSGIAGPPVECTYRLPRHACMGWWRNSALAGPAEALNQNFAPANASDGQSAGVCSGQSAAWCLACACMVSTACDEYHSQGEIGTVQRSLDVPVAIFSLPDFNLGSLSASLQIVDAMPYGDEKLAPNGMVLNSHAAKVSLDTTQSSGSLGLQTLSMVLSLSFLPVDLTIGATSNLRPDSRALAYVRPLPGARALLLGSIASMTRLKVRIRTRHRGLKVDAPVWLYPSAIRQAKSTVLTSVDAMTRAAVAPPMSLSVMTGAGILAKFFPTVSTGSAPGLWRGHVFVHKGMPMLGHVITNMFPAPVTILGMHSLALAVAVRVTIGTAVFSAPLTLSAIEPSPIGPSCNMSISQLPGHIDLLRSGLSPYSRSGIAAGTVPSWLTHDGCGSATRFNVSEAGRLFSIAELGAAVNVKTAEIKTGIESGWITHIQVPMTLTMTDDDFQRMHSALGVQVDKLEWNTLAISALDIAVRGTTESCATVHAIATGSIAPKAMRMCMTLLPTLTSASPGGSTPSLTHVVAGVVSIQIGKLARIHFGLALALNDSSTGSGEEDLKLYPLPDSVNGDSTGSATCTVVGDEVAHGTGRSSQEVPSAAPSATASAPPSLMQAAITPALAVVVESLVIELTPSTQALIVCVVLLDILAVGYLWYTGSKRRINLDSSKERGDGSNAQDGDVAQAAEGQGARRNMQMEESQSARMLQGEA